jgi:hypothetical protein
MKTLTPSTPGIAIKNEVLELKWMGIHTSLDSYPSVVHVTSNMSEDLAFETELADRFAVCTRLLRSDRRSELNVLDTELVQCSRNGNFRLGIEGGIGELFTLYEAAVMRIETKRTVSKTTSESAVDDAEVRKIGDGLGS